MRPASFNGCVFFLLLLCNTPTILGKQHKAAKVAEQNDEPETEMELCQDEQMPILMSVMKNFRECLKDKFYIDNSMSSETRPIAERCLVKCIFKREKALDASGALTLESFQKAMKGRVSGKLRGIILKAFKNCYEQFGALLKPDDESCQGFDNIAFCIQPTVQNVCEGPEFAPANPGESDKKDNKEEL